MSVPQPPIDEVVGVDGPMQPLPGTGPGYRRTRSVRTGDCDRGERLRLDAVARYLQDAATDHIAELGLTDTDGVWVVRRTVIDTVVPIRRGARVELRRWCSAMSTRWSTMRADIDDGEGGRIETEAFWIKFDPDTGMPARISDELEADLVAHTRQNRLRWRALLPDPVPAHAQSEHFPLRSTDIDLMQHVNNAVYLEAIEGLLARTPELRDRPHRTVIEYLRPIAPDAQVHIAVDTGTDRIGVWFVVDGVEHARAAVIARD